MGWEVMGISWQPIVTASQGKTKLVKNKIRRTKLNMCECTWSVNCDYVLFCCFVLFFRLGESCSHVGAVVFKLEACVCLGYNKVTYTSVACAWNGVSTKKK